MIYTIIWTDINEDGNIQAELNLDPMHPVFEGHFPGQPVLPGVVMLQIQRDVIEKVKKIKLILKSAANIKYLLPIVPAENKILKFKINLKALPENLIGVQSELMQDETICMKFNGTYKIESLD